VSAPRLRHAALGLGVVAATLAVAPPAARGQDSLPALNSLRTPASPAFVLLGIAPTAVERPATPADLAFSVLNQSSDLSHLPRDAALEFSPYWLMGHPRLTWRADSVRTVGASLRRTFTVSFATADLGTDIRPVRGLALGLRASPLSGHLADSAAARYQRLEALLTAESAVLDSLTAAKRESLNQEIRRAQGDTARVAELTRAKGEAAAAALTDPRYLAAVTRTEAALRAQNESRGALGERQGFVMEVAGGLVWAAPGGAADSARIARWGGWVTAGYEGPRWSFLMVNRILGARADSGLGTGDPFDALDVGVRLLHASDRYAVSAEAAFRVFTERGAPDNQYRIAAVLDYEMRQGIWLTATFGRDYAGAGPGSLLAQFGLSLDFAGQRLPVPLRP
jgi:hypothetical protein